MLKQIILILLFITSIIYPQHFSSNKTADFKLNEDNSPSTIVQSDINLFPYFDNGFIAVWKDYRNGVESNFAQAFDSLGNKLGDNFEIYGNKIVKLNENYILSIKSASYSTLYAGGSYYETAKIVDKNGISSQEIDLGRISTPFCGTGDFGYSFKIHPLKEGFLSYFGDLSTYNVSRYDFEGNLINSFENNWEEDYGYFPGFSFASLPNDDYMFAYYQLENIDSMGIYCDFYNKNDSLLAKKVFIKRYSDSSDYVEYYQDKYFYNRTNVRCTSFDDSTYSILCLDIDSSKFYKFDYSFSGEFISSKSISVPDNENLVLYDVLGYDANKQKDSTVISFSFITYVDGEFFALEYKIYLDKNYALDKTEKIPFKPFDNTYSLNYISKNEETFYSASDKDDVFLIKSNDSLSVKINDDESGSNEVLSGLEKAGDNIFVIYSNETRRLGKLIDMSGNILSEVELDSDDMVRFFSDGLPSKFWKRTDQYNNPSFGFTLYNSDWSIKKTILDSTVNSSCYLAYKAFITNTDKIISIAQINNNLVLKRINKNGEVEKQIVLTRDNYYVKSIYADEESFWISTYFQHQKFSFDLEPISDVITLEYVVGYLGNDLFATHYDDGTYAYAFQVIKPFGDSVFYSLKNCSRLNSTKICRLDDKSFISMQSENGEITINTYRRDDYSFDHAFILNDQIESYKTNPLSCINNDKAMFVWQDNRNEGFGYDIYGSIFDLDEITDVDVNTSIDNLPTEFILEQNYPNPFNPTTTINYTIPVGDANFASPTTLVVYDVLGNEIKTLVNEQQPSGKYSIEFDGFKPS